MPFGGGGSYLHTTMVGATMMVLTLSMWLNIMCLRRLNEYTAGVMHIEAHADPQWRARMGKDDVRSRARRQSFRRCCPAVVSA